MITIASSPCTHKHTLTGASTQMETSTIQKPSCSLSLDVFPEEDRGDRHKKLSPSMATLEPQLYHFGWLSQEHTGVLLFLQACPFLCPLQVWLWGSQSPHMLIIICFQLHCNFGQAGTPVKTDFTLPVGKSWGPGCKGLEKLEKNPRRIKLLKLPKQYGQFLLQLVAHQN